MNNQIYFQCSGSVAWEILSNNTWIDASGSNERTFFSDGTFLINTKEFSSIRPILKGGSLLFVKLDNKYESSPSQPAIEKIAQKNNQVNELEILLPSVDVNGDQISGLTKLVIFAVCGEENTLIGKAVNEMYQLPNVFVKEVSLLDSDAGTKKKIDVPILEMGKTHFFAAVCKD